MDLIECPLCKSTSPAGEWLIVGRSTCGFSIYRNKIYDEERSDVLTGAICPRCRKHIEFFPEIKITLSEPNAIYSEVKRELQDDVYANEFRTLAATQPALTSDVAG